MSTALKLMTVEEFLSWAEGKEGRWELHDGVPVMMSPERLATSAPKRELCARLKTLCTREVSRARRSPMAWPSRSTPEQRSSLTRQSSADRADPTKRWL
jgi:Uma2 family endonuclease